MTDTPLEIATRSLERMARVVADSLKTGPGQVRNWPYPDASEILAVFQDYIDLREAIREALIDIEVERPIFATNRLTNALKKGGLR